METLRATRDSTSSTKLIDPYLSDEPDDLECDNWTHVEFWKCERGGQRRTRPSFGHVVHAVHALLSNYHAMGALGSYTTVPAYARVT